MNKIDLIKEIKDIVKAKLGEPKKIFTNFEEAKIYIDEIKEPSILIKEDKYCFIF